MKKLSVGLVGCLFIGGCMTANLNIAWKSTVINQDRENTAKEMSTTSTTETKADLPGGGE